MKIAIILLARIGSQRLPKKMLHRFAGKYLIEYTLDFMTQFEYEKYVFSNDEIIKKLCEDRNINYREKLFESNEPGHKHKTVEELKAYNKEIKADIIILLQATSPFRDKSQLELGLQKIINNKYDIAFAVQKIHKIIYDCAGNMINKTRTYTGQNDFYIETGAYYIFKLKQLDKVHITEGKRYFCLDEYGIDIDTKEDLLKAELLYREGFYD